MDVLQEASHQHTSWEISESKILGWCSHKLLHSFIWYTRSVPCGYTTPTVYGLRRVCSMVEVHFIGLVQPLLITVFSVHLLLINYVKQQSAGNRLEEKLYTQLRICTKCFTEDTNFTFSVSPGTTLHSCINVNICPNTDIEHTKQ